MKKTERIYGLRTLLHTLNLIVICVPLLVQAEEVRPGVLRTPDSRFENLPDYNFSPNYMEIEGYRVHYIDEGPRDGGCAYAPRGTDLGISVPKNDSYIRRSWVQSLTLLDLGDLTNPRAWIYILIIYVDTQTNIKPLI